MTIPNPLRLLNRDNGYELWRCPTCGALCYQRDRDTHEQWHKDQEPAESIPIGFGQVEKAWEDE